MIDWQTKRALRKVLDEQYTDQQAIEVDKVEELFDKVLKVLSTSRIKRKSRFALFDEFVEYIFNRNRQNFDSMILISGDKGCLTDDSLIMMPRDIKKYPQGVPIKDLLNKGPIYIYSFNPSTKKLEIKLSDGAVFAKRAEVFELELKGGEKIKATSDHPFMLMDGSYKKLKDIIHAKEGSQTLNRIIVEGKSVCTDRLRIVIPTVKQNDCIKYNYNPINKDKKDSQYKHCMVEHRFIASQVFDNYSEDLVVHHKDGNHYNNAVNNLEVLTTKEHCYKHKYKFFKKGNKFCYATGYSTSWSKVSVDKHSEAFCEMVSRNRQHYIANNYQDFKNSLENNGKTTSYIVNGGVVKSIRSLGFQNVYDITNVRDTHNFIANGFVVSNTGKSSFALMFAKAWCKCINRYLWAKYKIKSNLRFNPKRHIAYSNTQVLKAIDTLEPFEPLICDEAIDFAAAQNWNKRENKELKIRLGKIRTKHLLFILCWPWKINKLDSVYFTSYINYWIDLYERGQGALFVKDKNPYNDPWKLSEFKDMESFTEFTKKEDIERVYAKHSNFWSLIYSKKPSKQFYEKYLEVREANVYNNKEARDSLLPSDIYNAFIVKAFEDIFLKGSTKSFKRLQKHMKELYNYEIKEQDLKDVFANANMLVKKIIEEQAIDIKNDEVENEDKELRQAEILN